MSNGLSALIIGATGATGKQVLREVLSSEKFTRVGEYGRRVTPPESLPSKEKLEQKVINFENLDAADLRSGRWDVVFITLGTTRGAAGSAAGFEKIDRQYVLDAAQAARSEDATHKQRLIYVSTKGANSKSTFLYPRSKGLTEDGLAKMGYEFIAFRPAFLVDTERSNFKMGETAMRPLTYLASFLGFASAMQISVPILAKSIRKAGELGVAGIPDSMKTTETRSGGVSFTMVGNSEALKFAASD